MKIARVKTAIVKIPYHHGGPPTGFGVKVWTTLDTLLVRVDTDQGLTGWGARRSVTTSTRPPRWSSTASSARSPSAATPPTSPASTTTSRRKPTISAGTGR